MLAKIAADILRRVFGDIGPDRQHADHLGACQEGQRIADGATGLAGILPGDDDAPRRQRFDSGRHHEDGPAEFQDDVPRGHTHPANGPILRSLPGEHHKVGRTRLGQHKAARLLDGAAPVHVGAVRDTTEQGLGLGEVLQDDAARVLDQNRIDDARAVAEIGQLDLVAASTDQTAG